MFTLYELAEQLGGTVHGDGHLPIHGINSLELASSTDISFLHASFSHQSKKYRAQALKSQAGAILLAQHDPDLNSAQIVVPQPYVALAKLAALFHPQASSAGIHPTAVIDETVVLGEDITIGAHVAIARGCCIGSGSTIGAGTIIEEGVVMGERCKIHPRVSILHHSLIGSDVTVQSGAVIGSDGFGFATDKTGTHHKLPQLGRVVIENHVEIGANTTIDRATFGETRIAQGSKIDNLVQIGHNVQVEKNCIIVSQSGIAGSSRLGSGCVLGAQTGIAGHLIIAPGAMIAARGGVAQDIKTAGAYGGAPAVPLQEWRKQIAIRNRLPEWYRLFFKHMKAS